MTIRRDIKRHQRAWANTRGMPIDQYGYLPDRTGNLYLPLSAEFAAALEQAGGGETSPQRNLPAKVHAVHSSAVLAINVFQYWEGRTGKALPQAFGYDGDLARVEIEQQYPTGLEGVPPTLDVTLTLADGRLIAIESKFTEWMTRKRPGLFRLRDKYLRPGTLWADVGLPMCQQLAAEIAAGAESFLHLDALQLLKHALGLRTSAPACYSLMYLYYDDTGPFAMAERHRDELARFAARVDAQLRFRALSYQALYAAMTAQAGIDQRYLDYLRARYFSQR
jgi:hypothetical protein